MSENQQPLTEEEQTTPQAETAAADEAALSEAEETALPAAAGDDAAEEPEAIEEEPEESDTIVDGVETDPLKIRVFGLPLVCFHSTAIGLAGGYIVSGLFGLIGFENPPSPLICAVVCAAAGYLIGQRTYKKRLAAREAELAAQSEDNPE